MSQCILAADRLRSYAQDGCACVAWRGERWLTDGRCAMLVSPSSRAGGSVLGRPYSEVKLGLDERLRPEAYAEGGQPLRLKPERLMDTDGDWPPFVREFSFAAGDYRRLFVNEAYYRLFPTSAIWRGHWAVGAGRRDRPVLVVDGGRAVGLVTPLAACCASAWWRSVGEVTDIVVYERTDLYTGVCRR